MQTILGAGGAIGTSLARELPHYTSKIRLVSRNPEKVNDSDELLAADLTDARMVHQAIEGSEIVYLTVGFQYDTKIWREHWPRLMSSVLDACQKYGAKLVFFDNVYMYDRDHISHMTEDTPIRPTSQKGEVRALISNMLLDAVKTGSLTALIARGADFTGAQNSVLTELAVKNLMKGKKAIWFASIDKIHNFTYTPDAGKAVALLGNTPDAYNQVWHVPSNPEKYTARKWIDLYARELEITARHSVMPLWMMGLVGIFMPIIREFREMAYQYNRDYYFDSSKFERRFGLKATPAETVVKESLEALKNEK